MLFSALYIRFKNLKKVFTLFILMKRFHLQCLLACLFFSMSLSSFGQKKIGQSVWMTTNLNVAKFRNGDPIPQVRTVDQWKLANENQKPAWCYYKNDSKNGVKYGRLYNWYAVIDPRGLAPKGWHIPNYYEWEKMLEKLNETGEAADMLKSTTGWNRYITEEYESGQSCIYCNGSGERYSSLSGRYITCAICGGTGGNLEYHPERNISGNGNNKSGFLAKPAGFRLPDGDFMDLGNVGSWWSISESDTESGKAWDYTLDRQGEAQTYDDKGYGLSVRCVKD
jgi:uncharacterized protein (TIGR02145 family)